MSQKISDNFASQIAELDPMFSKPYIDVDEWRDTPIRHRYLHGGFEGTDTRFSFYFPEKGDYRGRFFQYITPVPDNENLSQNNELGEADKISFAISHGSYFIETNGGGSDAGPMSLDNTIGAYKANAAAAMNSKAKAAEIYGPHRTYGYAFGGSGGAYRTVGGIENTKGVWDGAVPYVIGSPMAIPNVFTVRMHAMRVLKGKFPQIVDAIEPGGTGDPYAGLNTEEKAVLMEVTKMGFPIKAWFNHKNMGVHAFPAIFSGMEMADAGYFKDYWTVPGYFGADRYESVASDRVQQKAKIKKILTRTHALEMGLELDEIPGQARGTADLAWKSMESKDDTIPVAFQLDQTLPAVHFLGGELQTLSGKAQGKNLALKEIKGDIILVGIVDPITAGELAVGDEVQVDNSNWLAAQTYHRHQVPGPDYPVWDQFRDENGAPIYPQRPMLIGPLFTRSTVGSLPSGKINGKVIILASLMDTEAFPWQADWYRQKVEQSLGLEADNQFRIWFTDRANHGDAPVPGDPTQIVSYLGTLQQALLDLSDWVEKGIEPASNTQYSVVDGQVLTPDNAEERGGIQPLVHLKVNGGKRTAIRSGEKATFTAEIALPAKTGKIVAIEWDFEGSGTFIPSITIDGTESQLQVSAEHRFDHPGTYFAVLRVASQREGKTDTPFTLIRNLDRVRIVVE